MHSTRFAFAAVALGLVAAVLVLKWHGHLAHDGGASAFAELRRDEKRRPPAGRTEIRHSNFPPPSSVNHSARPHELKSNEASAAEPAGAASSPDPIIEALWQLELGIRRAATIADAEARAAELARACVRWAEQDPEGALAFARQLRLDETDRSASVDIVQQWAAVDVAAARQWVIAQPTGEQREEMLARVGFAWSQSEPAEAARFVLEHVPPGPRQDEAVLAVLHQWALIDPAGAQRWADRFPPGELRGRARAEVSAAQRQPVID
jgi:hypothetical protein